MASSGKAAKQGNAASLPLPTLLSRVLVAYTIELDDEFERLVPHRTTDHGVTGDGPRFPWLVSLVMYANFMRFIPEEGVSVRELYLSSGFEKKVLRMRLQRMARWWGYITFAPPSGKDISAKPPGDWMVRPGPGGLKALQAWRGLFAAIEERWERRFGKGAIDELRASLSEIAERLDPGLPEYLPILNVVWAGWFAEIPETLRTASAKGGASPHLSALLSRVLMAFALDFECESDISLAIGSNLLRIVNDTGVRMRDLPRLSGVSREAIKMMMGFLTKHRFIAVEADPVAARTRIVRLTAKGIEAQHAFEQRLAAYEKDWQKRFGKDEIGVLRKSLEALAIHPAGDPTGGPTPLMQCLGHHAEGWRASKPLPETLPHYPLVLHRGGFPDGS
jgi:DNA-binding MarR family transcriptional regulator